MKPHPRHQLPHPRRYLGAASPAESAQDRALSMDYFASGATLALHPAPRVHGAEPSATVTAALPLLATPICAQGERNCTLDTECHHRPLSLSTKPPPRVRKIAPSVWIAPSQEPPLRCIPRRGCTGLHPRQQLGAISPFFSHLTSTQGARDCILGAECRHRPPSFFTKPPPRVQKQHPQRQLPRTKRD